MAEVASDPRAENGPVARAEYGTGSLKKDLTANERFSSEGCPVYHQVARGG